MSGITEYATAPNVGDGNPNAVSAIVALAEARPDLDVHHITLASTSLPARIFHRGMTADPNVAEAYINNPGERTNLKSRVYAAASSLEFATRAVVYRRMQRAAWTAGQEHAVLGASELMLSALGIDEIRLATADVFPKDSGLDAARKHGSKSTIYVWNQEAQDELEESGFRAALTAPYLSVYRQGDGHEGHRVVAKTSGSGIPSEWRERLVEGLGQVGEDWVFHTPDTRYTKGESAKKGKGSRHLFFEDVGTETEVIIGYPSELMGMVAGRNELERPTWIITLPPRGAHEMRNLLFGLKHGIVLGELALKENPSIQDGSLRRITLEDLPKVLGSLAGDQPDWARGQGIIGTRSFWDVARPL